MDLIYKNKIVFLSPVGYFKGGAERSLFDLISNPAVIPIIIVPEPGPIFDRAHALGLECYILDFGRINTIRRPFSFFTGILTIKDIFLAAHNLKKISKKTGATLVHSNGLKAHMINCFSRRVLFGSKAVIHIRDIPFTRSEKLVWKIMKHMCDSIIIVSHACWPENPLPRKIHVIHNGTPLIDSSNVPPNTTKNIKLGFIGRIHPAKGLHLLVEWLAAARLQGIPVELSIRGNFAEETPEYKSLIEKNIISHNLKKYVSFSGFINDPVELYKDIDIVVVPSETPDPLPRSVMEAMARGIPVFGYPAGGISEMIDNKLTGYLIKNSAEFISALNDISSNPELLASIIQAGRKKIEEDFTIPKLHNKVNTLYSTL